jgi:hypothetical protein
MAAKKDKPAPKGTVERAGSRVYAKISLFGGGRARVRLADDLPDDAARKQTAGLARTAWVERWGKEKAPASAEPRGETF